MAQEISVDQFMRDNFPNGRLELVDLGHGIYDKVCEAMIEFAQMHAKSYQSELLKQSFIVHEKETGLDWRVVQTANIEQDYTKNIK